MAFKIAVAVLKWQPDSFWKSTPREFFLAIDAHKQYNGSGSKELTPSQVAEVKANLLHYKEGIY